MNGQSSSKQLIHGLAQLQPNHAPCVASIGNYDGVHLGHQHVIKTLLRKSDELGVASTVITFDPLAKEYFSPQSVFRLTSIEERVDLLFGLGVDRVLCIEFDAAFSTYSPLGFIDDVLIDGLGVRYLCVGDDFRFGYRREGDFNLLKKVGAERGFDVAFHETFQQNGSRVSSGRVREALAKSDFTLAAQLLGRLYTMSGRVAKGQQLGRTIGFPTANIVLPDYQVPISGVFAVRVLHPEFGELAGVANVGNRPTVDGIENRLEVHLFDFSQDIYGDAIQVIFVTKLRDEQKFDSFELLTAQIQHDAAQARQTLEG